MYWPKVSVKKQHELEQAKLAVRHQLRKSSNDANNDSIEVDDNGQIRRKKAGEYARPWRDAMQHHSAVRAKGNGQFESLTDVGTQRKARNNRNSSLTTSQNELRSPQRNGRKGSGMRKFTSEGSLPPGSGRGKPQLDYLAEMRIKR